VNKSLFRQVVGFAKASVRRAAPGYRAIRGTLRMTRFAGVGARLQSAWVRSRGEPTLRHDELTPWTSLDRLLRRPLLPPTKFCSERIQLIVGSLSGGGSERQVAILGASLARDRGLSVEVLCWRVGGKYDFYKHLLDQAKVPVVGLEVGRNTSNSRLIKDLYVRYETLFRNISASDGADILALADRFLTRRPGVVHCYLDECNVKGGLAAAMVGVPRIVLSGRSGAPEQFLFYQPYWRQAYLPLLRCQRVCFTNNSRAGAADYARWLGLASDSIDVIHNGIDTDIIRRPPPAEVDAWASALGIRPGQMVIGAVSRLTEEKRPLLWVEAAAEVARRRPDAAFLVLGEGPLMGEVRERAHRLGIAERLFLPGVEPRVSLAISRMDVFMLTSRIEGLPNVLIEAQALGVPVVTTRVGGAADTLDEGRTGWSVASDDPASLAERVLWVLENPEWRQQASAKAPAFVGHRFHIRRMVDETLRAYGWSDGSSPVFPRRAGPEGQFPKHRS
jgi:glycosyltransferase involved in cell wall biosynthesis